MSMSQDLESSDDEEPEVRSAPMLEIFSIYIDCDSFVNGKSFAIYGKITVTDGYGTTHDLFDMPWDEQLPVISAKDQPLPLYMPIECAVSKNWVSIRMDLTDRSSKAKIVKSVIDLGGICKDSIEPQVRTQRVLGKDCFVFVTYGVVPVAVAAEVDITLQRKNVKDNTLESSVDMYGSIVASYGNTYGNLFPDIVLFKQTQTQSQRVVSGNAMDLCRDLVVVPAYSFLKIEVNLLASDRQGTRHTIVNGDVDFWASDFSTFNEIIDGEDFRVKVEVSWRHPYLEPEEELQPPKLQGLRPCSLALSRIHRADILGRTFAELFSVWVRHNNVDGSSLYGKIDVQDCGLPIIEVFNRDENDPVLSSSNRISLPIFGPPQTFDAQDGLAILLNLRDCRNRGRIYGDIAWNYSSLSHPMSWYDRRICSLIRGGGCYAAIYYSIFKRAVQALVKIAFISHNSNSTEYERDCYQSVLYRVLDRQYSSKLRVGDTLPLLKNVVAVPTEASLIIQVNLGLSSTSAEENLQGSAIFEINPDFDAHQKIGGRNYDLVCSIEWSRL